MAAGFLVGAGTLRLPCGTTSFGAGAGWAGWAGRARWELNLNVGRMGCFPRTGGRGPMGFDASAPWEGPMGRP